MTKENIILFTGQSGIQVKKCLSRINETMDNSYQSISIEETMSELSGRDFRKEILKEKLSYQYKLWADSFKEILRRIENDNDSGFFVNLHGIFYHQDKREYVSVIDYNLIQKLKNRIKFLIVFIDDIYDIYQRLLGENEMFHEIMLNERPLDALFESIFNLKSLLEWRQIEITISRIISRMLGIRMFIIATKHPTYMIKRLVENELNDLEFYYISHPISEIRRNSNTTYETYPGELNMFIQDIKKYPQKIFFLPTTIDEYRIQNENELIIPEFYPRWPLHFDKAELINGSFSLDLSNPNPLNPLNLDYNGSQKEIKESISILLKLLLNSLYNQITSRDLSLVEQSTNGLILYRPDYPSEYSGGVVRELRYNIDLYKKGEENRNVFRLSLEKECVRNRIYSFFNLIKKYSEMPQKDEKMKKIYREIENWISEYNWLDLFEDKEKLESGISKIRELIENYLGEYSFDDTLFDLEYSLKGDDLAEKEKNRSNGYDIIIEKIFQDLLSSFMIRKEDFRKFKLSSEINLSIIFNNI
ncbi:MAG: hypothetical protein EU518_00950 [Promethearchaeota archaeon]|nr:MAG: hypothetical protein EU518_00950 [Candidatus Lokiarchaeota archaeon]